MKARFLNDDELNLMTSLLRKVPNSDKFLRKLTSLRVKEMNDGGMGSLSFLPSTSKVDSKSRSYGKTLIEVQLKDEDEVPINVSINLDKSGELYELDIWKVDFSPLKKLPVID